MAKLDGGWGEAAAAAWAERQGMRVLARNHRCPQGEVDLVLLERGVIVFAEVKARRDDRMGSGLEAVSRHKRRRVALAAIDWLARTGRSLDEVRCRFDAVEVRPGPLAEHGASGAAVQWVRDAFDLDGLLD